MEVGVIRRCVKEGFVVNGLGEDFLDGMKVQCFMVKLWDCNVLFQNCCCICISFFLYI